MGTRSRAVTLDDVARTSGVSRATASRALNGRARVAPEVRARVTMIARSLGYRPNTAARSLVSGRADIIGLVLPIGHLVNEPYEAHVLEAVAATATEHGQGVMLWLAADEPNVVVRNEFRTGVVDGLIISGVALGASWVEELLDGPHPCVIVGRHPSRNDVPTVEIDNAGGTRRAVGHLVAGGHQRLAMVLGPAGRVDADEREAAFRAAVAEHGLPVDERLVARGTFRAESGYAAVQQLLPHRPDAVFAANDPMAVGVLQALRDAGVSVPDQIAVVGFDDLPIAATTDPPLTTVRHDIDTICTTAVQTLLDLIDARPSTDHPVVGAPDALRTVVPTSLVVRSSTRPVDGAERRAEHIGVWEAATSHTPSVTPRSEQNRRATS